MSPNSSLSLFSHNASNDLEAILGHLNLQANHILRRIAVLRGMGQRYTGMADECDKREYATVIQSQVAVLGMDFGVIKLNAELVTDEQISDWVEDAAGLVERDQREGYVRKLWEKMKMLQDEMVGTRRRLVDMPSD